mmetsp:Transcript_5831/g.11734  ORF Transcript_5831/g.11734 Transcript_5831/m.11734 type:complete len:215 (+) Transcript_5831:89-733(+)
MATRCNGSFKPGLTEKAAWKRFLASMSSSGISAVCFKRYARFNFRAASRASGERPSPSLIACSKSSTSVSKGAMPRSACSLAEKALAKGAGTRPVRMPACHAPARCCSASTGRRLQVTYCASRHVSPSLGKFSCGIRESQAKSPPWGTMTFTRRPCISSSKGTVKGTILALRLGTEPSGCSWLQRANSLWKPGTVTKPPEVALPPDNARRPCTP